MTITIYGLFTFSTARSCHLHVLQQSIGHLLFLSQDMNHLVVILQGLGHLHVRSTTMCRSFTLSLTRYEPFSRYLTRSGPFTRSTTRYGPLTHSVTKYGPFTRLCWLNTLFTTLYKQSLRSHLPPNATPTTHVTGPCKRHPATAYSPALLLCCLSLVEARRWLSGSSWPPVTRFNRQLVGRNNTILQFLPLQG